MQVAQQSGPWTQQAYTAYATWVYSCPCNGEPEVLDAIGLHQLDITVVLMVEVICNVTSIAIYYFARCVGVGVPNAGPTPALVCCSLELRMKHQSKQSDRNRRCLLCGSSVPVNGSKRR